MRSPVVILIKSGKSWGKECQGNLPKPACPGSPGPFILEKRMLRKTLLGGGSVTGYRARSETEGRTDFKMIFL